MAEAGITEVLEEVKKLNPYNKMLDYYDVASKLLHILNGVTGQSMGYTSPRK